MRSPLSRAFLNIIAVTVLVFFHTMTARAAFSPGTVAVVTKSGELSTGREGAVFLVTDGVVVGQVTLPTSPFNPRGSGFDAMGRLHVSEIETHVYDSPTNRIFTVAAGGHDFAFDAQGNTYLAGDLGSIAKYDSTGSLTRTFTLPHDRVAGIDLARDQCILWYVYSQFDNTGRIASYNLCQDFALSELSVALPAFSPFSGVRGSSLRILPNGDFLISGIGSALRISPSGTTIQTYSTGGADAWVGLALDASGTQFWVGVDPSELYRIDLASGVVVAGPIQIPPVGNVRAVTSVGEWRAGMAAASIPTTSPLILTMLAASLAGIAWRHVN